MGNIFWIRFSRSGQDRRISQRVVDVKLTRHQHVSKRSSCSYVSGVVATFQPAALLLSLTLCGPEASAQVETTAFAGGTGGNPFTLSCPANHVLVGIRGKEGLNIDSILGLCSRYDTVGNRVGALATTSSAGGPSGNVFERKCPGNEVVIGFGTTSGATVSSIVLRCGAMPALSGGFAGPTGSISGGGVGNPGIPGNVSAELICPSLKIAIAITGNSGLLIDRIALQCNRATLAASRIYSIATTVPAGTSGIPVSGSVTLDGYALNPVSVSMLVSNIAGGNVAGTTITPTVTVPSGSSSGSFQLAPPPTAAGCAAIEARAFNTSFKKPLVLTPPPSRDLSFTLTNVPSNLRFPTTGSLTINGSVTFGSTRFPTPALASGRIGLSSSNTAAVQVPAAVDFRKGDTTVPVRLTAVGTGCAVITATTSTGSSARRVVSIFNVNVPDFPDFPDFFKTPRLGLP